MYPLSEIYVVEYREAEGDSWGVWVPVEAWYRKNNAINSIYGLSGDYPDYYFRAALYRRDDDAQ